MTKINKFTKYNVRYSKLNWISVFGINQKCHLKHKLHWSMLVYEYTIESSNSKHVEKSEKDIKLFCVKKL